MFQNVAKVNQNSLAITIATLVNKVVERTKPEIVIVICKRDLWTVPVLRVK